MARGRQVALPSGPGVPFFQNATTPLTMTDDDFRIVAKSRYCERAQYQCPGFEGAEMQPSSHKIAIISS
jgi:hypothetical protein